MWPRAQDDATAHSPFVVRRDPYDGSETPGSATICFDVLVQQRPVDSEVIWWTDLVRLRPVVVCGFPCHRQPNGCTGLEVSYETLEKMQYHPTGLDSGEARLTGPNRTLALVKQVGMELKRVFVWEDVRCLDHNCNPGDDREWCFGAKTGAIREPELMAGTHIILPCGNIEKRADKDDGVPAPAGSKCSSAARSNSTDGEPGFSSPGSGSTVRTGLAQQGGWPLSARGDHMELAIESLAPTPTDTSYESDLLSISDPSESLSSLDQRQPAMPCLRDAIVRRLVSGYQSHVHGNSAANTSAPAGSGATTTSTTSSSVPDSASNPSGPCRPNNKTSYDQRASGGDEDDDDDNIPPPPKRSKRIPSPNTTRLLACPFWKADSHHHIACYPKVLTRLGDVKLHLRRNHYYSRFSCPRCAAAFPSAPALRQHVSNPAGWFCTPSSSSNQLGPLSPEQLLEISCRSDRKLSEEDQWFALWDLVFPGRPRPRSAYREVGFSEELGSFREFCATHSGEVLDAAALDVIATGRWPGFALLEGEERREILAWCVGEGVEISFMAWRAERTAATAGMGMGSGSSRGGAMSAQDDATPSVGLGEEQPLPFVDEYLFGSLLEPWALTSFAAIEPGAGMDPVAVAAPVAVADPVAVAWQEGFSAGGGHTSSSAC